MPANLWPALLKQAREEVSRTLAALAPPLRERASRLPITYEPAPGPDLVADGIAPDTLGLFVGEEFAEEGMTGAPMPAQIILFLKNLWDYAEADPEIFREEVRITLLHELGHYLGLNEDDLDERSLG